MIHRGNQPEKSPAYLTLHELGEVSCMPEACTYGSRSGINSFTKVRSGRRPVCPCCTLTLWDFLFVTGCWCQAESAAQGTVLTERWSSARSLHISPYLVLIGQSVLLAAQQQETHCVTIILRHMLFADFLFAPASACSTQRQTRSKTSSVLNPRDDVTSVRRLSDSDFRSKKGSWNRTHVSSQLVWVNPGKLVLTTTSQ